MPVEVIVRWHGKAVRKVVASTLNQRLEKTAQMLEDYMKGLLDTPYPPASKAGEPPHRRTGKLKDAITHVVTVRDSWGTASIGVMDAADAVYAKFLEVGTVHMSARPFLTPTLVNNKSRIMSIMGQSMNGVVAVAIKPLRNKDVIS